MKSDNKVKRKLIGFVSGERGSISKVKALALGMSLAGAVSLAEVEGGVVQVPGRSLGPAGGEETDASLDLTGLREAENTADNSEDVYKGHTDGNVRNVQWSDASLGVSSTRSHTDGNGVDTKNVITGHTKDAAISHNNGGYTVIGEKNAMGSGQDMAMYYQNPSEGGFWPNSHNDSGSTASVPKGWNDINDSWSGDWGNASPKVEDVK